MVRVADPVFSTGKEAALHEFVRRINEVKAATECAIERDPGGGFSVLVVRLLSSVNHLMAPPLVSGTLRREFGADYCIADIVAHSRCSKFGARWPLISVRVGPIYRGGLEG